MIRVGTQYQNILQLRNDLEALLTTELGTFPNGLPAIWVEDRQARAVSGGVAVILQPDLEAAQTTGKFCNQTSTSGEWMVTVRSFGSEEGFRVAKEKIRQIPQNFREIPLPYREGVVPQTTFRISATINRNTWM